MAYERSRQNPDGRRRRAGASDSSSDPIGRLDEVLVTLEKMLEDRGVPPASRHHEDGEPLGHAEEAAEQESLPLLQDVVAPAPGRDSEGSASAAHAEKADAPVVREPLPLGFEIVPEETMPEVTGVEPDPPVVVPEGRALWRCAPAVA